MRTPKFRGYSKYAHHLQHNIPSVRHGGGSIMLGDAFLQQITAKRTELNTGQPIPKTDLRQQKTQEWHKFTVKNIQLKHRPQCSRESVGAFLKHRKGGVISRSANMLQKTKAGSTELREHYVLYFMQDMSLAQWQEFRQFLPSTFLKDKIYLITSQGVKKGEEIAKLFSLCTTFNFGLSYKIPIKDIEVCGCNVIKRGKPQGK